MRTLTITTNNVPRPLIYGMDLTPKEAKDFDYIDAEEFPTHNFFRYRGDVYDLQEFVRIVKKGESGGPFAHCDHGGTLKEWDAIATDSYFSAVVIRFTDDTFEEIVVGLELS